MHQAIADSHIHTELSGDSILKLEWVLESAPSLGISALCPTEHYDPLPTDPMMAGYDHSAAVTRHRHLSGLYSSVKLGLGVEISYRSHGEEQIKQFLVDKEFDVIIGSVHDIGERYIKEWMSSPSPDRSMYHRYIRYFDLLLCAARSGMFPILGHLDYLKKYDPYPTSSELSRTFDSELYAICSTQLENGGVIEVNASGFRHAVGEPYPSKYILDIYRNAGGKYVTVGSDAHAPQHLTVELYEATWNYCRASQVEVLHWAELSK